MTPRGAVHLDSIVRRAGGRTLIPGLSLTIAEGEIYTLLGPSGCGKTTTLRMVAGLDRPDGGHLWIGGEEVAGTRWVPPEARRVGMVFQSHAVWPHRTVLENVAYPLVLRGEATAHARAREALARVRLDGMGDRFPHTLSGGQQQRVALARAVVSRPRVLLLDEPLSSLDAGLRVELRGQIAQLAREEGLTVLLVTHDQEEALEISDRIAVMREGRIEQEADPRTLYDAPANRFVAGFVGTVNLLPAERRAGRVYVSAVPVMEDPGPDGFVEIGFRPEGATFSEGGLPAVVEHSAFRGSHTRHRLRVAGTTVLIDSAGAPGAAIRLDRAWVHGA